MIDLDVPWGETVPDYGKLPPCGSFLCDILVHWAVIDIPASVRSLVAGASPDKLPPGAKELETTFVKLFNADSNKYQGPAPPKGMRAHRYQLVLYALDIDRMHLSTNSDYAVLTEKMAGHVIATAQLSGFFGR